MVGRCRLKHVVIFTVSFLVLAMCAIGCAPLSTREDTARTDTATGLKPIESAETQREPVIRSEHEDHSPKATETKDLAPILPHSEQEMAPTDLAVQNLLHPASKLSEIDVLLENEGISFYIFTDGKLSDCNVSYLADPPRLVVDLVGLQSSGVSEPLSLDGPWVKKVRVGLHAGKVRVVFDLISEEEPNYQIIPTQRGLQVLFIP
jgi:hypothetical protein